MRLTEMGYPLNNMKGEDAWTWLQQATGRKDGGDYHYVTISAGSIDLYTEIYAYIEARTTLVNSPHHFFRYLKAREAI